MCNLYKFLDVFLEVLLKNIKSFNGLFFVDNYDNLV